MSSNGVEKCERTERMAQVYESANLYRNAEMDKSENGVVVGVPIIGSV